LGFPARQYKKTVLFKKTKNEGWHSPGIRVVRLPKWGGREVVNQIGTNPTRLERFMKLGERERST